MLELYNEFGSPSSIKILMNKEKELDDSVSYFVIEDRSYTKRLSEEEISFMKFLLPNVKFIPYETQSI